MICGLRAKHIEYLDNKAVVELSGGVLYEVHVPDTCRPITPPTDYLYIYHHINERGQALYGFGDAADRVLFKNLISVDKVGPTAAIKLMGSYEPEKIRIDIADKDVDNFSKAKGIGKMTAEKIIDKLYKKYEEYKTKDVQLKQVKLGYAGSDYQPVKELSEKALIKLGFKVKDSKDVVRDVIKKMIANTQIGDESFCGERPGNDVAEHIVREALKELKG